MRGVAQSSSVWRLNRSRGYDNSSPIRRGVYEWMRDMMEAVAMSQRLRDRYLTGPFDAARGSRMKEGKPKWRFSVNPEAGISHH